MEQAGSVISGGRPGRAHVVVRGRLDTTSTERLRGLLDDVTEAGSTVTIDLSRAGGLPVGVLRALAATHRRLADGGGSLVVVAPSRDAVRSLEVSGLRRVLRVDRWPGASEVAVAKQA